MNFTKMTAYLDSIPALGVPGFAAVIQKEGNVIYRHAGGFADRENGIPMTGQERFYLYSASKLITCTAALTLWEKGAYLLDDPLSNYLPEYASMKVRHVLPDGSEELIPAENSIKIRHLFTMSAGFDYETEAPEIKAAIAATGGKAPTREIIRGLAKRPLLFEPGTHWNYSLAHDVIGALIEVLSGKRFGEYVKETILNPLGMERTGFVRNEDVYREMMASYAFDPETGQASRTKLSDQPFIFGPEYESGGAGIISCLDDYARFAAALACGGKAPDGPRILSESTVRLMRTNMLSPALMADIEGKPCTGYGGNGYGYGLGVRTLVDPARAGAPSPIGEFGWDGAGGVFVLLDPVNRISMVYAQQMRPNLQEVIHPRLRNILYACLDDER